MHTVFLNCHQGCLICIVNILVWGSSLDSSTFHDSFSICFFFSGYVINKNAFFSSHLMYMSGLGAVCTKLIYFFELKKPKHSIWNSIFFFASDLLLRGLGKSLIKVRISVTTINTTEQRTNCWNWDYEAEISVSVSVLINILPTYMTDLFGFGVGIFSFSI